MSKEIIAIFDDLAKRFGVAINWTSKNILPYLQELFDKFISWEMHTSIAWICISTILLLLLSLLMFISYKKDFEELVALLFFPWIICIGLSIGIVCTQIFDIIECKTFPEKVLIDYIDCHNLLDD